MGQGVGVVTEQIQWANQAYPAQHLMAAATVSSPGWPNEKTVSDSGERKEKVRGNDVF